MELLPVGQYLIMDSFLQVQSILPLCAMLATDSIKPADHHPFIQVDGIYYYDIFCNEIAVSVASFVEPRKLLKCNIIPSISSTSALWYLRADSLTGKGVSGVGYYVMPLIYVDLSE